LVIWLLWRVARLIRCLPNFTIMQPRIQALSQMHFYLSSIEGHITADMFQGA